MCFYRLNKINEQQVPNLGNIFIDYPELANSLFK